MQENMVIRKGQRFKVRNYGNVIFKGFDRYMGQLTAKLESDRGTHYPFPDEIEEQGFTLIDSNF